MLGSAKIKMGRLYALLLIAVAMYVLFSLQLFVRMDKNLHVTIAGSFLLKGSTDITSEFVNSTLPNLLCSFLQSNSPKHPKSCKCFNIQSMMLIECSTAYHPKFVVCKTCLLLHIFAGLQHWLLVCTSALIL